MGRRLFSSLIIKTLINQYMLIRSMNTKNRKLCPNCKSDDVKIISYIGIKCVVCNNCGFDESRQYDVYPEEKKSQKEKGKYTPYKAGGFKRTK